MFMHSLVCYMKGNNTRTDERNNNKSIRIHGKKVPRKNNIFQFTVK